MASLFNSKASPKLNDNFDFFLPLAGIEKYAGIDETEADVKASGRLARLHDEITRTKYHPCL